MIKKDAEVLFLYESYDELVLLNLGQFDKKNLKGIENDMAEQKEDTDTVNEKGGWIGVSTWLHFGWFFSFQEYVF